MKYSSPLGQREIPDVHLQGLRIQDGYAGRLAAVEQWPQEFLLRSPSGPLGPQNQRLTDPSKWDRHEKKQVYHE